MKLNEILEFGLTPAVGAISWVASRWVQRRKRNNDFLSDMQSNIDMLVDKYSSTLKELIELKQQNSELVSGQEELKIQLSAMRRENSKLKSEVDQLNIKISKMKSYNA
ncbi:MAG: hypothetical protein JXR34_12150 [Bacteroidales bacterium]|nr:hypothetical protein [Bacteroidales bacterium]